MSSDGRQKATKKNLYKLLHLVAGVGLALGSTLSVAGSDDGHGKLGRNAIAHANSGRPDMEDEAVSLFDTVNQTLILDDD